MAVFELSARGGLFAVLIVGVIVSGRINAQSVEPFGDDWMLVQSNQPGQDCWNLQYNGNVFGNPNKAMIFFVDKSKKEHSTFPADVIVSNDMDQWKATVLDGKNAVIAYRKLFIDEEEHYFCVYTCETVKDEIQHFNQDGVHDSEVKLKQDLTKTYVIDILPPHSKTTPIRLEIELIILAVRELDFKQQILITDCWTRLVWNDTRLKWDKSLYNDINMFRIDTKKIWTPDIFLYNSVHGKHDVAEVYAKVDSTGKVTWVAPYTFSSYCDMDIRYYPYDQHECVFKFGSWTHDGWHIHTDIFENKTKATYSYQISNAGEWKIASSRAMAVLNKFDCCEEPWPDATFYLTLQRRSPFFKATVLSPVVAVVGLILTTFWISPVASERMVVSCVALLVSVASLMNLTARLPPTGDHAPLVVSFTSTLTILSMVVTIVTAAFANVCKTRLYDVLPHWMDVILQTRVVTTIFCIVPPESFKRFGNQNDSETVNSDDVKLTPGGAAIDIRHTSPWIPVFQLVDRIAFVLFSIILSSILIALSS